MNELWDAFRAAFALIAGGDHDLTSAVLLSLRVSLTAVVLGMAIGIPCAAFLAIGRMPGRDAVIVLFNAMLGLPPVAVGLFVYLMLSRAGPLGSFGLLFTPTAMIIAQTILATPIVIALVHRQLVRLWGDYGDALQIDGAGLWRSALILLAAEKPTLITTFLTAFGRAIAEVGAIIVVGGNIRGATRTMTTTIALETSKGDLALALGLGVILVGITLAISILSFGANRWFFAR